MSCPYCGAHTYFDQESPCASIELWECGTRYDSVVGDGYMQSRECERRVKEEDEEEKLQEDMISESGEICGEKIITSTITSTCRSSTVYYEKELEIGGGAIGRFCWHTLEVIGAICGIGCVLIVLYLMFWMLMHCGAK